MSSKTSGTENSIERKQLLEDANELVIKRAQFEAFEFELETPGLLTVINGSHENPDDHRYRVNVEDGVPCACECPAFEYGDGPCKHMISIVIREPVLQAAQWEQEASQSPTMADGGQDVDICPNGQEGCCGPTGDDLPCFDCYRKK